MVEVSVALTKDADFLYLGEEITRLKEAGADRLHLDVADSSFGMELTYGWGFAEAVYRHSRNLGIPVETHLMVRNPGYYTNFPGDTLIFHAETFPISLMPEVKCKGKKFGIAFKAEGTELRNSERIFSDVDQVLVLAVSLHGDHEFVPGALEKIRYLSELKREKKHEYEISVDGGMNLERAALAKGAGADIVVSGSYVLGGDYRERIESIKQASGVVPVEYSR